MTTILHLSNEYENVNISANAYSGTKSSSEPYISLKISQNTSAGSNEVVFFVNSKDKQDFAQRIHEAIMSLPDFDDKLQEPRRSEQ